jgi:hypothetical protein
MSVLPPLINGTLREHYVMLFGAAGTFAMFMGFVGAWVGARFAAHRALREVEARNREALDVGMIRELGASMEAIGLEVERISEAQRFVAKVLAERSESHVPVSLKRENPVVTPH